MTKFSQSTASKLTYAIVTFMRRLTIAVAGLLLVVIPVLFWKRSDVIAALAKDNPAMDSATAFPALVALLFAASLLIFGISHILRKLEAILNTVRNGNPFVRDNGTRLRHMGWMMIGLQCGAFALGVFAAWFEHELNGVKVDFSISLTGILAILLCFVLAQVFDQGTDLAEDVEGTV